MHLESTWPWLTQRCHHFSAPLKLFSNVVHADVAFCQDPYMRPVCWSVILILMTSTGGSDANNAAVPCA